MKKLNKSRKPRRLWALLTTVLLATGLVADVVNPSVAEARNASSRGMCYLRTQLDTGNNGISASVDLGQVGDKVMSQKTKKTPEYEAEDVAFGKTSWSNTQSILGGSFADETSSPWNYFTNDDGNKTFENDLSKDWTVKNQSSNMVMSFPGWGGGNTIQNLAKGEDADSSSKLDFSSQWNGKRNTAFTGSKQDNEPSEFYTINSNLETSACNSVNQKLISSFQDALDDFYAHVKGSPTLSTAGIANMVLCVAEGYMPAHSSTEITYNEDSGTFSQTGLSRGKLKPVTKSKKSINSKTKAGATLVELETPNYGDSNALNRKYTYAVVKGATPECGAGQKYSAADEYALTWMDVADASISNAYNPHGTSNSAAGSNKTTVVADQVNNYLNSMATNILNAFGIQSVDQLVFGDGGNLFRNSTYGVYMALWGPFLLVAMAILVFAMIDAYRKANAQYLSTNEVGQVQKSIGRVFNATIMIIVTPIIIPFAIGVDQALVKCILDFDSMMSSVVQSMSDQQASWGWGANISGIITAFLWIFVNIKFTFRYIARALSFGIYFMTSPIVFALDALKSDGGLFQYGPSTGEAWKNMLGLIFQRAADALGIVFALSVMKLIFGNHVLITIMSCLIVEQITNALMGIFGIQKSTFAGVADAAKKGWSRSMGMLWKGTTAGLGTAAGLMAAKGIAAKRSRNNWIAAKLDRARQAQRINDLNGTNYDSSTISNFDTEAPGGMSQAIPTASRWAMAGTASRGVQFDAGAQRVREPLVGRHRHKAKVVDQFGERNWVARTAWGQGFGNRGVYGDKDTNPLGKNGVISGQKGLMNDADLMKRYEFDSEGNLRSKKGYRMRNALDSAAAFMGGATHGAAGGAMIGAMMGAAAAAPGSADKFVGGVIAAHNLQNGLTNDSGLGGYATGFSHSFVSRLLGMKEGTMQFDKYNPNDANGGTPHGMMRKNDSGFGAAVVADGIQRHAAPTKDGVQMNTTYTTGIKHRVGANNQPTAQARAFTNAHEAMKNLDGLPQTASFDDLRDNYLFQGGQYHPEVGGLLAHMQANGYNSVSFPSAQSDGVTFGQQLVKAEGDDATFSMAQAQQGNDLYKADIAQQMQTSSSGIVTEPLSDQAFVRGTGEDADTISRYVADEASVPQRPDGLPVADRGNDETYFEEYARDATRDILETAQNHEFKDQNGTPLDKNKVVNNALAGLYGKDLNPEDGGTAEERAAERLLHQGRLYAEDAIAHRDSQQNTIDKEREQKLMDKAYVDMTPEEKKAREAYKANNPVDPEIVKKNGPKPDKLVTATTKIDPFLQQSVAPAAKEGNLTPLFDSIGRDVLRAGELGNPPQTFKGESSKTAGELEIGTFRRENQNRLNYGKHLGLDPNQPYKPNDMQAPGRGSHFHQKAPKQD